MLGSETAETNLRTMLFACYLQLLGVDVGERHCGDESADDAVPMLFAAVGGRCWGTRLRRRICGRFCYHAICSCWVMLPCYLQLLGVDVGERDCGDESADDDVTMLFAAVGGIDVGEQARGDESADAAVTSETAETKLRTMLLPCYLQLSGVDVGGARLRRRICGRCCYHAICSCWV